ncbi:B3 domain-containing protein Os04g0386900-like [Momordica charantia]|uniref:B3 domain-containing protein Os04g0386900-like n=1 Tax=Momordica charantia TaxID=3673 RepID=A0A6J1CYN6_MOMCH|nr:B3 domain-containing protein Os04g0386900-like [Momordica charantia]XP_022146911.1 B3 domain-containing protein Os04g0386900-like [Momordica charantia]
MQSQEKPPSEPAEMEPRIDEIFPLSNKPFHGVILGKSHVAPAYLMSLPAKFHSVLPAIVIHGVVYCGGKEWRVDYYGNRRGRTLDTRGWRKFVDENHLKYGDACVFELMECSSSMVKFRVQILRGDIPVQLHDKFRGESRDTPINID